MSLRSMRSWSRALVCAVITLTGAAALAAPSAHGWSRPGEVVRTASGAVRGNLFWDQRSYLGIPFAASTAGERRFAPPVPRDPWSGIRDARANALPCPQAVPFVGVTIGTEDCLTLDVHAPPLDRSRQLPVMVWFYGGAYALGSTATYPPGSLVTKGGVIVVGVNYRVGPGGFLALPGLTGNQGIQDQQAGLRWVRENIAAFGGDPGNVTIFGESAGGNSVCQQLASPAAAGLFAKAIVMSGACGRSAGGLDARPRASADETGRAFARSVGCTEAATMVACLRGKSVGELFGAPGASFDSLKVAFGPVQDGTVLTGASGDVLASGAYHHVPVMIGGMHDEARLFVLLFEHLRAFRGVGAARYEAAVRELFGAGAPAILARYPLSSFASPDIALGSVWTDALFSCAADGATRALVRGGAPTYAYEFVGDGYPLGNLDPWMPLGAFHAADVTLLFDLPLLRDPAQQRLSEQLVRQWTTFARTGTPNGPGLPAWPPASDGSLARITVAGQTAASLDGFAADHDCAFWQASQPVG